MTIQWTPDRIALLTQLWAKGWTSTSISRVLDVSRNSVASKIAMLDLPTRKGNVRPPRNRGIPRRPEGWEPKTPAQIRETARAEAFWGRDEHVLREAIWDRARRGAAQARKANSTGQESFPR